MNQVKRPVKRLNTSRQYDIFNGAPSMDKPTLKRLSPLGRTFQHPDPDDIFLGVVPLKKHFESLGIKAPMTIRRLLDELDWTIFESAYGQTGRAPYSPALMVGLILYGILNNKNSLRELETFARSDLGAMYITGGIYPDHSIIGRFIQLHADTLQSDFFIQLTHAVLKETKSGVGVLAGDGTLVESAASSYNLLRKEAVEKNLEKKIKASMEDADNPVLAKELMEAQETSRLLESRREARKEKGKDVEATRISRTDPEAVVQPVKKTKAFLPSYKPSILVNESRVITGFGVDPSNEGKILFEMLNQVKTLSVDEIEYVLLDAGYHAGDLITKAKEENINLLCPPGNTITNRKAAKEQKKFSKKDFKYDALTDTYTCPNGETLDAREQNKAKGNQPACRVYRTAACANCPLANQCTTSKKGRMIKRYECDAAKEELALTMSFPEAKELYKKRKGMVEAVFSGLKNEQGLRRFKRRGLASVRVEFALHVLAYNISRVLAYFLLYCLKNVRQKCQQTQFWVVMIQN